MPSLAYPSEEEGGNFLSSSWEKGRIWSRIPDPYSGSGRTKNMRILQIRIRIPNTGKK
jgi:hypothetical protein